MSKRVLPLWCQKMANEATKEDKDEFTKAVRKGDMEALTAVLKLDKAWAMVEDTYVS